MLSQCVILIPQLKSLRGVIFSKSSISTNCDVWKGYYLKVFFTVVVGIGWQGYQGLFCN